MFLIVSSATAQPKRLSHALASSTFSFVMTVNGQIGIAGSPGRTPASIASCLLITPMSMNMLFLSTIFLRSSAVRMCGGFEPNTPIRSPLCVLTSTRWASMTCSHQPPSVWNLRKPSSSIMVTMKPTSSMCPATSTRGALFLSTPRPLFMPTIEPRLSVTTSP